MGRLGTHITRVLGANTRAVWQMPDREDVDTYLIIVDSRFHHDYTNCDSGGSVDTKLGESETSLNISMNFVCLHIVHNAIQM